MQEKVTYRCLDKDAFEKLFKGHFLHLCNFAVGYTGDMEACREIVQEVFLNLWQNRENIDPEKPVKSYLFTSVKNRCLNHIRDNKKFRSSLLDLDVLENDSAEAGDAFPALELQDQIRKALDKLPEKCREVFELNRVSGMKYKEVSEKLGISVKTVEAQISKALRILREELKDYMVVLLMMTLGS
ncbi:MAG: RNA polymerase sigma-70 factor [Bacteroidales bacterium]|nr:RNA polymerase sigma-70 factor [Bacteroidales bacterium]